jgi:hypothetical protein
MLNIRCFIVELKTLSHWLIDQVVKCLSLILLIVDLPMCKCIFGLLLLLLTIWWICSYYLSYLNILCWLWVMRLATTRRDVYITRGSWCCTMIISRGAFTTRIILLATARGVKWWLMRLSDIMWGVNMMYFYILRRRLMIYYWSLSTQLWNVWTLDMNGLIIRVSFNNSYLLWSIPIRIVLVFIRMNLVTINIIYFLHFNILNLRRSLPNNPSILRNRLCLNIMNLLLLRHLYCIWRYRWSWTRMYMVLNLMVDHMRRFLLWCQKFLVLLLMVKLKKLLLEEIQKLLTS